MNKELNDWYQAYNKPKAVSDWLEHNPHPKEKWILLIDADMLLRRPFLPEEFNLTKGWAMAAHYDYMKVCRGRWRGSALAAGAATAGRGGA
jgi:hypothetical protein